MTNSIMFLLCVDHSLRRDSMHALPVRKPAMQLHQRSLVVKSSRLHPGENLSAPQLEIMDIKRGGQEVEARWDCAHSCPLSSLGSSGYVHL